MELTKLEKCQKMIEDGSYEEQATQNSLLTFTLRTSTWQNSIGISLYRIILN